MGPRAGIGRGAAAVTGDVLHGTLEKAEGDGAAAAAVTGDVTGARGGIGGTDRG